MSVRATLAALALLAPSSGRARAPVVEARPSRLARLLVGALLIGGLAVLAPGLVGVLVAVIAVSWLAVAPALGIATTPRG